MGSRACLRCRGRWTCGRPARRRAGGRRSGSRGRRWPRGCGGRRSLGQVLAGPLDLADVGLTLVGRRVGPYSPIARRIGNAREVRSSRRAEPCPPARGAPGRGLALLSCSCRAQTVGLDHRPVGRVGPGEPSAPGNAAHARGSGPSHHGCLQILGLDGSVSVTGRRVKPYSQSGHGHAGVLGITVKRAADSSLQLQP